MMCMRVRSFARRHILESPTQMTRCSGATCMRDDLPSCATFSCGASGMKGALCIRMPCIGGWGVLNREIVSFRSCVRTRGPAASWNWISNSVGRPFPFSLLLGLGRGAFPLLARVVPGSFPFSLLGPGAFPFPFPHPPNLLSNFSWAYRYLYL